MVKTKKKQKNTTHCPVTYRAMGGTSHLQTQLVKLIGDTYSVLSARDNKLSQCGISFIPHKNPIR